MKFQKCEIIELSGIGDCSRLPFFRALGEGLNVLLHFSSSSSSSSFVTLLFIPISLLSHINNQQCDQPSVSCHSPDIPSVQKPRSGRQQCHTSNSSRSSSAARSPPRLRPCLWLHGAFHLPLRKLVLRYSQHNPSSSGLRTFLLSPRFAELTQKYPPSSSSSTKPPETSIR